MADFTTADRDALKKLIREIPDFPKKGILFYDITTLLKDRKPGKLPAETVKVSYDLEYGSNALEVHKDAIAKGQRVLIVDDLLATGGTAVATAELASRLGARIAGFAFVVELDFLKGRDKLAKYDVFSLLHYDH